MYFSVFLFLRNFIQTRPEHILKHQAVLEVLSVSSARLASPGIVD